jgi:hypothetical protein
MGLKMLLNNFHKMPSNSQQVTFKKIKHARPENQFFHIHELAMHLR